MRRKRPTSGPTRSTRRRTRRRRRAAKAKAKAGCRGRDRGAARRRGASRLPGARRSSQACSAPYAADADGGRICRQGHAAARDEMNVLAHARRLPRHIRRGRRLAAAALSAVRRRLAADVLRQFLADGLSAAGFRRVWRRRQFVGDGRGLRVGLCADPGDVPDEPLARPRRRRPRPRDQFGAVAGDAGAERLPDLERFHPQRGALALSRGQCLRIGAAQRPLRGSVAAFDASVPMLAGSGRRRGVLFARRQPGDQFAADRAGLRAAVDGATARRVSCETANPEEHPAWRNAVVRGGAGGGRQQRHDGAVDRILWQPEPPVRRAANRPDADAGASAGIARALGRSGQGAGRGRHADPDVGSEVRADLGKPGRRAVCRGDEAERPADRRGVSHSAGDHRIRSAADGLDRSADEFLDRRRPRLRAQPVRARGRPAVRAGQDRRRIFRARQFES